MTALLAVHVLMNVRLEQSLKVNIIPSIQNFAQSVELVQTFAQQEQSASKKVHFLTENVYFRGTTTRSPSFFAKKCKVSIANMDFFS